MAASVLPETSRVLGLVEQERRRQIDRWGGPTGDGVENPTTPDGVRLRVLVEEVGEVAEAMGRPEDGNGTRDLRTELTQVAAVAVAWLEALDAVVVPAAEPRGDGDAGDLAARLAIALIHTQEYVGDDVLPPLPGWSWFEALYAFEGEEGRAELRRRQRAYLVERGRAR